jgi:hypothetical protein
MRFSLVVFSNLVYDIKMWTNPFGDRVDGKKSGKVAGTGEGLMQKIPWSHLINLITFVRDRTGLVQPPPTAKPPISLRLHSNGYIYIKKI